MERIDLFEKLHLLSQAFALSMPHAKAMEIKEEVAFFQAVKARLVKFEGETGGKSIQKLKLQLNR